MNLQQVMIKKSLKVKTNRKNYERNQSKRKSSKRRKTKSKSNRKNKSKKSKKRKFKNSDGTRDPVIEKYSTQLKEFLLNKTDHNEDIYEILDNLSDYYNKYIFTRDEIQFFFHTISWSIPTSQNINDIIKFIRSNECSYILEIGSGLGLWASILRKNDIIVHATDDLSYYKDEEMFYTEIENINYKDALKKYKDENACLFLCWPPKDDLAKYCLQHFNGKYLIYIGQGKGGKNGNLEFFKMLADRVNSCCELVKEIKENQLDEGEEYTKTHIFNDYTNINIDNDKILFYRITDIGKFIIGMMKRENLDNLETITFHKEFGNNLEEKITYTNSEYKFKFIFTKQRLEIRDKKTDSFKIVYYPSDACAYKFKDEEITELK